MVLRDIVVKRIFTYTATKTIQTLAGSLFKAYFNLSYRKIAHCVEMSIENKRLLGKEDVAEMRINYKSQGLEYEDLTEMEPYTMFDDWFKKAKDCKLITEPNAMAIATVSHENKPSVRLVLMKGYDRNGLRFFTNYKSRKGRDMEQNSNVSVMFYWEPLEKQVRIEGTVEKLSCEESAEYFHKRPRASQLGALASHQSQVIPNQEIFKQKYKDLEKQYEGIEIPKPDFWGGYNIKPERFEFWCGGKGRMHDRIVFRKLGSQEIVSENGPTRLGKNGWVYEFLYP